jgi:hypothetical protein
VNDAMIDRINWINLAFKITEHKGKEIDVDGTLRRGVMIWFGVENECNHYQVYARSSEKFPGYRIGVQAKCNPGKSRNIKDGCAGKGYTNLGCTILPEDVNIFDGCHHELCIVFDDVYKYSMYLDGFKYLEITDKIKLFNHNSIGIRTDNVKVEIKLCAKYNRYTDKQIDEMMNSKND